MPKRADAAQYVCPECEFQAGGPRRLGTHYEEFPSHRPFKRGYKRSTPEGSGVGRPMGALGKETLRKAAAAEIIRSIALQADATGEDFSAGLSKLLKEPNIARLELYLRYIFQPVMAKLLPETMSEDAKELRLKEIEASIKRAEEGGEGGVHISFPLMAAPDGSQPALPGKTVQNVGEGDIIEVTAEPPKYDDDFD